MESQTSQNFLKILHFNDVYVMEERDQDVQIEKTGVFTRGGAARFVTAMKAHGCDEKLVLFSGDLLSPSLLSRFFKGHQFVEVFDKLNVRATCLGNHDVFDFGAQNLKDFIAASDERRKKKKREPNKWLMANFYT